MNVVQQLTPARSQCRRAELPLRLRQRVRDRGAAGRAAGRPQLAAALRLRPLRRAAFRLALHRAARRQRALLALPHPPHGRELGPVPEGRSRASGAPPPAPRSRCRRRRCAGTRCRSPREKLSFIEGVRTVTTAGDAGAQAGMAAHLYLATRSMADEYFYNADGEMLFVPQQGELRLWTEFGVIDVAPGEVAVIPRGVKLRVELPAGEPARGYLCENYGGALTLPERGPIGANCLANPRDFLTPVAAYEDREAPSKLTVKWGGTLVGNRDRRLAARRGRLARQLRALQIRPPALLAGRPGAVRPRRPLDLHRADLALGDPGHRQHRLRLLSRPLAGGREHLPPALVPHERHERVHGAHLRRLRRQDRRRLRARRLLACTTPCCPTGRTGTPSKARAGPSSSRTSSKAPWPSCSRPASRSASPPTPPGLSNCSRTTAATASGCASCFDPTRRDW